MPSRQILQPPTFIVVASLTCPVLSCPSRPTSRPHSLHCLRKLCCLGIGCSALNVLWFDARVGPLIDSLVPMFHSPARTDASRQTRIGREDSIPLAPVRESSRVDSDASSGAERAPDAAHNIDDGVALLDPSQSNFDAMVGQVQRQSSECRF